MQCYEARRESRKPYGAVGNYVSTFFFGSILDNYCPKLTGVVASVLYAVGPVLCTNIHNFTSLSVGFALLGFVGPVFKYRLYTWQTCFLAKPRKEALVEELSSCRRTRQPLTEEPPSLPSFDSTVILAPPSFYSTVSYCACSDIPEELREHTLPLLPYLPSDSVEPGK